jgi:hypothetical protein
MLARLLACDEMEWQVVAHIDDPDSVVLHKRAGRAEQNDTTIRRVVDQVVADDGRTTADTDTVGPLLIGIRSTGTDVIVLDNDVVAEETTLGYVEAGPTAWIIRVHILNQLVRVWTAHLYICTTISWGSSRTSTIDLYEANEYVNFLFGV